MNAGAVCSVIKGTGSYLPDRIMTNDELSHMVDTSDKWVRERTGIISRHIAAEGEYTSDLALQAAHKALAAAGYTPADIDLIIVATTTPDLTFPSTASIVQNRLDIKHGAAFDLQAVCCGFIYALTTADALMSHGVFRRALVIGAETMSRLIDWSDRSTCVLFGDGAGAVVLEAVPEQHANNAGIKHAHLRTDGSFRDLLYMDGGASSTRSIGHLRMEGTKVFRQAVTKITESVRETLEASNTRIDEVDWFVPHQANQRILTAIAENLGIPDERVITTVASHGNTSAASVPLALDVSVRSGQIKPGDLILAEAIGAGLTWGSVMFRL